MSLTRRLSGVIALVMSLLLLGMGIALYWVAERDLQSKFEQELTNLARIHAGLAVSEETVMLQYLPESRLREAHQNTETYLLFPDGTLLEAQGGTPPQLTSEQLAAASRGDPLLLFEGQRRSRWEMFQPRLDTHTRIAAHPIQELRGGQLVTSHLVLVRARDEATMAALGRLRREVFHWLLFGLVISILTGLLLARVISRPVLQMAATAAAVQNGDLSVRVPGHHSPDELGQLAANLNAMLERLEALVSAQRRFTSDAAHDLRTPIAVLRGEAELALRRERSAEEYRTTLQRMGQDLQGLSRLAEDLLTLARLESSAPEAVSGPPLALSEVLALPVRTAQRLAAQRGLHMSAEIEPGLWVQGDASLIGRAVLNLCINALTHGGHTHLRVTGGRALTFEVSDSGPGLPDELRGTAFDRFARGLGTEGSGLGLAIVREIARVHGGELTYQGPPHGRSCFTLRIPQPELKTSDTVAHDAPTWR